MGTITPVAPVEHAVDGAGLVAFDPHDRRRVEVEEACERAVQGVLGELAVLPVQPDPVEAQVRDLLHQIGGIIHQRRTDRGASRRSLARQRFNRMLPRPRFADDRREADLRARHKRPWRRLARSQKRSNLGACDQAKKDISGGRNRCTCVLALLRRGACVLALLRAWHSWLHSSILDNAPHLGDRLFVIPRFSRLFDKWTLPTF
jgi:hypothetical protein